MKISLDLPDVIVAEIQKDAQADGHNNKSAVIRKAITFYLSAKSQKVAPETRKARVRVKATASA